VDDGRENATAIRWERTVNVQEILAKAQDSVDVKRVYGAPIEKDGLTIIPAASVSGGGGGGGGPADSGGGVGYGVRARPVGAFIIKDGEVRWEPAVDATRLALRGMLIPIIGLITARSIVKTLAKRRR
jgi:uncharacterized spore protein YtfJ